MSRCRRRRMLKMTTTRWWWNEKKLIYFPFFFILQREIKPSSGCYISTIIIRFQSSITLLRTSLNHMHVIFVQLESSSTTYLHLRIRRGKNAIEIVFTLFSLVLRASIALLKAYADACYLIDTARARKSSCNVMDKLIRLSSTHRHKFICKRGREGCSGFLTPFTYHMLIKTVDQASECQRP